MHEQPTTEAQSKYNNTTLSIRLTAELKELLIHYASLDNISPSRLIREAITKEIESKRINLTLNTI